MKLIDPINAVITFNMALREDETMPVEATFPVQTTVPAGSFGRPLAEIMREALASQLPGNGEFRLLGEEPGLPVVDDPEARLPEPEKKP